MYQIIGDYTAVTRWAHELMELCDKYNFPPFRAHALVISGWACAMGQDSEEGLALIEAEFPRASAIGPLFRYYATLLAEARMKFGKTVEALALIQSLLTTVNEPGVGAFVPELYREQGLCLFRLDPPSPEETMKSLRMAVEIAKQQKALLYELKAAISLAETAVAMGQPEMGLPILRDLWVSLPDGFDAPQLEEGRQLLRA